jgi:hypothetical protein
MTAALITYDLNNPGQKYEQVHKALQSLTGTWCKVTESCWIVAGYGATASAVWNAVEPFIDGGDRVLTLDITGDTHSGSLTKVQWDWINKNG